MKFQRPLHQMLAVLAALPLAGALVFGSLELSRLLSTFFQLREQARIANVLIELSDVASRSLSVPAGSSGAAANPELGASLNRLRVALAGIEGHETAAGARPAFARVLEAGSALAQGWSADRSRDVEGAVLEAIDTLKQPAPTTALRARYEGLAWITRLGAISEVERQVVREGLSLPVPTMPLIIAMQNAKAMRQNYQATAQMMAPRELATHWQTLFTSEPYQRVETLTAQVFPLGAADPQPFQQQFAAPWDEMTAARADLIAQTVGALGAELRAELARAATLNRAQLQLRSLLVGATLLVSAGLAALLIPRIRRTFMVTFRDLQQQLDAIAEAVATSATAAGRLADSAVKEAAGHQQISASLTSVTTASHQSVATATRAVEHTTQMIRLLKSSHEKVKGLEAPLARVAETGTATSRIVGTIDEIAFQTRILALNASIEAASAGSAGVGFVVVAGEVRQLAARVSEATAQTGPLVEDARTAITQGCAMAGEVATTLGDVEHNAEESNTLIQSIQAAAQQMVQNLEHVSAGNDSLERVMQENAAIAERNTQASAAMAEEVTALRGAVLDLQRKLIGSRA